MADTYISGGEAHIALNSEDWSGYCDFLRTKLEGLEEQKKNLDDRIAEIHAILNPPVIEDVEDEEEPNAFVYHEEDNNDVQPEEKFLLVEDIANKYNVTIESVKSACDNGKVPCHGRIGNWKFTQLDVEKISSIVARQNVFESRKPSPYSVGNPTAPAGKYDSKKVRELLGVSTTEMAILRRKEILVGQTIDNVPLGRGVALFYDIHEVEALKSMMDSDGGKDAFIQKLRERSVKTA